MSAAGVFVALEGGDGAGKSTQARRLAEHLRARGYDVVLTFEPGDSSLGPALRALLLDAGTAGPHPRTEALLYAADRAQHVAEVVRPALDRGAVVVTDRFVDSSIAYQGAGRGLGVDAVAGLSAFAVDGVRPDLVVLLDLPPAEGLRRRGATDALDRIEAEPPAFHERIRAAFLAGAARDPERYAVVDASADPDAVAAAVAASVDARLQQLLRNPAGAAP